VPNNYEFEYLQTQFAGLKEATSFLYEYLATTSQVPQSIIKGSALGELASAEKDQRDYYEKVQSDEQQGKIKPLLEFLIPFLLWERDGTINKVLKDNFIDPDTIKVEIEFNPLQSVNPLQDAQIGLIEAQTDATNITNGVIKPEEARSERFPELESFIPGDFKETSQFATMGQEQLMEFFKSVQLVT
jgi:phage-related protein (TIGR01555 family)